MARIKEEQETVIVMNEATGMAHIWSASPRFQRKMEQYGVEPYEQQPGANQNWDEKSSFYWVSKDWIRVKPPRKVKSSPESLKNLTRKAQHPSTESREAEGISIQA
jgi:hypothetical protein